MKLLDNFKHITSPLHKTNDGELPVMETFYTIQGEGYHQGKAAYFIRLGGCDVGCVWCDVKESWDATAFPKLTVENIVSKAKECHSRLAVVTGGEPLMYDLAHLTGALKKNGFYTHLETSGAYPITGQWDWICLSPKKFKKPVYDIFDHVNELKVIIFNKTDFDWAEKYAGHMPWGCKLYLQPEWSKAKDVLPGIISYVKKNPHWEISLQIHKFMDIP